MIVVEEKDGKIAIRDYYREVGVDAIDAQDVSFVALKTLAQRYGKLVFKNVYELILFLQKHVRSHRVIEFVWRLFGEMDLYRFIAISDARSYFDPNNDFVIMPKEIMTELISEMERIEGLVFTNHEFNLEGLKPNIVKTNIALTIPTKLGFVRFLCEVTPNYVSVTRSVTIECDNYEHTIYLNEMTTGDLFIMTQILRENDVMKNFASTLPPVPNGLIDMPAAKEYMTTNLGMDIVLTHYVIGDLKGSRMVLPIIRPSGIAWEYAKITRTQITNKAIHAYYEFGGFVGKVAFVFSTHEGPYIEEMTEILNRNQWLVDRIRRNSLTLLQYLKKYEDYLMTVRAYARLIF